MTLLFVCTGNTCRSPLAVAAWEAFGVPLLAGSSLEGRVRAFSGGLNAVNGARVTPHAVQIASGWNVDLQRHRAQHLTEKAMGRADWILCMTAAHRDGLRRQLDHPERVRLLGEFADSAPSPESARLARLLSEPATLSRLDFAIADPIGGSREAYADCAAQIRASVEGLARALRDGTLSGSQP